MEKTKEFEMRTKLTGKNNIRLFRQVARRLASDIARCKQVRGMVFLERKNQVQETQIRDMVTKEAKRSGIDTDLEIHLLKDFAKWKWTEINRWDFSHAEIAFDKKEHIGRIIEAGVKVSDEFWTRRIVLCAEYMKWYCYPPRRALAQSLKLGLTEATSFLLTTV